MTLFDRPYDLYLILGHPASLALWNWPAWKTAAAHLDPLITAARGQAGVRTHQEFTEGGEIVPFGPLGWGEAEHLKWVLDSPDPAVAIQNRRFLSLELWAPDVLTCKSQNQLPDVYLALRNEQFWGHPAIQFNPYLLLAVASDLPASVLAAAQSSAQGLAEQVSAVLRATQRRPWGYPWGDGAGFTDAVNDLMPFGTFIQPDQPHAVPPSLATLAGQWTGF